MCFILSYLQKHANVVLFSVCLGPRSYLQTLGSVLMLHVALKLGLPAGFRGGPKGLSREV